MFIVYLTQQQYGPAGRYMTSVSGSRLRLRRPASADAAYSLSGTVLDRLNASASGVLASGRTWRRGRSKFYPWMW